MAEVTPSNIMVVIKTYCDVTGISLYDSLAYHDINKEKKVTWSEFLASFQVSIAILSILIWMTNIDFQSACPNTTPTWMLKQTVKA